eukprot:9379926-Alexandrium_andersonii.AAC.1
MIGGPDEVSITNFKMTFATHFLAKDTGKLRPGSTVCFIGRELIHEGTHIIVKLPKSYITSLLQNFGLEKSKPVSTTGTSTLTDLEITFQDNWDAAHELHQYRKVVGQLQRLVN